MNKLTRAIHLTLISSVLILSGCSRKESRCFRKEGEEIKDQENNTCHGGGRSSPYHHTWIHYYGGGGGVRGTGTPGKGASARGGFGSTGRGAAS